MTNEEREKLIEDMAYAIAVAVDPDDAASAALAITERALAMHYAEENANICDKIADEWKYDCTLQGITKATTSASCAMEIRRASRHTRRIRQDGEIRR